MEEVRLSLVNYLNNVCADKGITKKQLAGAYGCNVSLISRVLNGKQKASVDFLFALLDCAGCTVEVSVKY